MTLEFLKGFLSLGGPMKMLILAKKGGDGGSDARISLNKATVKIGKAQEDLDVVDGSGDRPFRDGGDSIGFHGYAIRRNNKTKEGDRGDMKLALAKLASQAVFSETG